MPVHDQLLGSTQPVLSISLEPGESIVAEAGEFAWMTDSIQLTTTPAGLSDYTAKDQAGTIAFASRLPGSIMHIEVAPGGEYLVHRNGFLAGTPGIEVTIGFQQPLEATETTADKFILRRIGGGGRAWGELSGDGIRSDLAAGTSLGTHPRHSPARDRPGPGRAVRSRNRVAAVDAAARRSAPPVCSPRRTYAVKPRARETRNMSRNAVSPRGLAGTAAVVAIAAGLAVAGCGGSSSSGAAAGGNAASKSPAASHSTGSSGSTSVTTATVPFPVGVGDTWRYRTTDGRTVNRIIAVTPASGGQQVTMRSAITNLGSTTHDTAYYVVNSDGSISLPFSQFDTSSSGASVKLISGSIFWPPADQLSSGKAYHDALKIEFSTNGTTQNVTAHVTVRGAGTQSVTVPAGTYNADVVNMTMAETIEGISVSSVVRTWLAPGVGPVKSEVILHEGGTTHVAAENQLVSFKAG